MRNCAVLDGVVSVKVVVTSVTHPFLVVTNMKLGKPHSNIQGQIKLQLQSQNLLCFKATQRQQPAHAFLGQGRVQQQFPKLVPHIRGPQVQLVQLAESLVVTAFRSNQPSKQGRRGLGGHRGKVKLVHHTGQLLTGEVQFQVKKVCPRQRLHKPLDCMNV